MTMKRLQNAYVVTQDMERAVAFYKDAMGLPVKFQDGTKWAQFDAGGTNFSLSSPEEAAEGAMGAVLIFEVDSIADASITIERNGGEVLGSRDGWLLVDKGPIRLTFPEDVELGGGTP